MAATMTKMFFWNGFKVHLWRDFLRVQGVWYWFNCLLWKRNCPKIAPYPNCKKERISDFFQNILLIGVERNRKQRNPVNSITSWIVSGTLLCTGSTGPFIAIGSLKDFFSSCKEEKFPRQDIRYYLKYMCKEEGRNTGVTRIFCQHVMIENRYLK